MIDYSLYLVTDERYPDLLERMTRVLELYPVTMVQYRAKHKSFPEQVREAAAIKQICDNRGLPLLIDDEIQVAVAVDAAGVHLGQDDFPCNVARKILGSSKIIGVTVHNLEQAIRAQNDGADYLGAGAVFPTGTKTDVDVMGLKVLGQICSGISLPVVGIGGITMDNMDKVLEQGAAGAAMVTGLLGNME